VTGRAAYTKDLSVPGILLAGVVRSAVAHARLRSVDVRAAVTMPGVHRVLTSDDLAAIMPNRHFGPVVKDCPLLADGVVRYEGEPIALVVARDADSLAAALEAVVVEYDDLPVLADMAQTMQDGALPLHQTAEQGQFGEHWADGWEPARNVAGQNHDLRGEPVAVGPAHLIQPLDGPRRRRHPAGRRRGPTATPGSGGRPAERGRGATGATRRCGAWGAAPPERGTRCQRSHQPVRRRDHRLRPRHADRH